MLNSKAVHTSHNMQLPLQCTRPPGFLQVYAPTLPGYGRAEKPSIPYSQKLWVEFLRDFVVEVARRPVVVVGNSIGGFLSASLAADYSKLVQGSATALLLPQQNT